MTFDGMDAWPERDDIAIGECRIDLGIRFGGVICCIMDVL
jgi:hypothetical protein